jgi:hypothetical protein
MFNEAILGQGGVFPRVARGRTFVIVGDFSGQHRGQHFDTYSFLALDLDCNSHWLNGQKEFRGRVLPSRRRMSFKSMNDAKRRSALVPFLRMASDIEGCLIQFAISKIGGSLFRGAHDAERASALLNLWKPPVQERLLRIIHLSAFVVSGLSAPDQDLLWIIDEDEIAANVPQLTQLTDVFARIFSNYASHGLRHLRCGTTRSDDGSLALEDLAAVADLSAGALSEVCTSFVNESRFPVPNLITPFHNGLSWKSRLIASWMATENMPLRRYTCIIELKRSSSGVRVTELKWHAVPGHVIVPTT